MNIRLLNEFLNYQPFLSDPQELVHDLIKSAKEYLPTAQVEKIQTTYEYAREAHGTQKRLSWEEYIVHPLKATQFLMLMKPDIATIQTCILHDVIEDTPKTYEDIQEVFGDEIATLCEWLVKVSTIKYRGEERQLETLKKTFLAMAHDLRVIFVKIADRIHNIQTLKYHPKIEKRERIANETMKVFVPITKRLWLYHYQILLENGSFFMLNPHECTTITRYIQKKFGKDRTYIKRGQKKITQLLHKAGIEKFDVVWRIKSPYRIYEKLTKKYDTMDLTKVMDVIAFRVITWSVSDCYNTLGIIHQSFTPLIKKIKDYISVPKFNGYKSLHTTVVGMFSFPVEVQIRTQKMDDIAEYWVAAHFAYSDEHSKDKISDSQREWIKKLQSIVTLYKENADKESFKKELNIELLTKSIFVYTPKGDIIEMPQWSTVLDFAFRVHSDVGLSFKNAIVNGVIKPIGFTPESGDIIQIKTFRNKVSATKYWLDYLHTPSAKNKLQKYVKVQERDYMVNSAKEILNSRLSEWHLPLLWKEWDLISGFYEQAEFEKKVLEAKNKQISFSVFFKEVYPEKRKNRIKPKPVYDETIPDKKAQAIIDYNHMLDYSLCRECHPSVNDKIIARTGKDGIKVHYLSCVWVSRTKVSRLLEAHREWMPVSKYKAEVHVVMKNVQLNLPNLLAIIADLHIVIDSISMKSVTAKDGVVMFETTHSNPSKIGFLAKGLKKHDYVLSIDKIHLS